MYNELEHWSNRDVIFAVWPLIIPAVKCCTRNSLARAVERTRGQKLMAIISSNCTTEWSSYHQSTFLPGTRQGLYPALELFSGISIVPLPDKNKNNIQFVLFIYPFLAVFIIVHSTGGKSTLTFLFLHVYCSRQVASFCSSFLPSTSFCPFPRVALCVSTTLVPISITEHFLQSLLL